MHVFVKGKYFFNDNYPNEMSSRTNSTGKDNYVKENILRDMYNLEPDNMFELLIGCLINPKSSYNYKTGFFF